VKKHRSVLAATISTLAGCLWIALPGQIGAEDVDSRMTTEIRNEGFAKSQVMDLAWVMTDVYGPRYANSPSYDAAARWAKKTLEGFGLANVELEAWGEFGYGWENTHTSIHMTAPQYQPVIGYPVPGTLGTDGVVTGQIVAIDTSKIFTAEDLEAWREKLKAAIVLVSPARELEPQYGPQAVRLSDEELREMARLEIDRLDTGPSSYGESNAKKEKGREPLPRDQIEEFMADLGVRVLVETGTTNVGPMDKGVVHVSGKGTMPLDQAKSMPRIVVAPEHYNRMMRLLDHGIPVEMEIEIRNDFHADDPLDYNVLAEIPGSDLADEIVLIGAHFDSEPAATGATDNASGSAIVMEAMRILAAIDAKPRRTIRVALWGAEEVGMRGSRGYVEKHLGDRETSAVTAAHENFSVYFNVDWYGRFRGIFLQGNDATRPIFEAWMAPFEDVGMSWIVPGNTGGTDHMAFLEVGLPGFQFIQDDLEFFNVTFHTNMDVYDRLVAEDLKQASVIMASFAFHAAMRDEKFPRADGIDNGRRWHK
jgi:carboxypeptidase Q